MRHLPIWIKKLLADTSVVKMTMIHVLGLEEVAQLFLYVLCQCRGKHFVFCADIKLGVLRINANNKQFAIFGLCF